MKKTLLLLMLLTSTQAFAQAHINFSQGFEDINNNVQKVAIEAAIQDCSLKTRAKIKVYKLVVDHIDQGVIDSYHTFKIYSHQQGHMIVHVFEPLHPTHKNSIKGLCKLI